MEERKAVRNFIIILVIVILFTFGFYLATKYLVNKDTDTKEETKEVEIDYTKAIVGTMLSKNDEEYYVLIYDTTGDDANTIKRVQSEYEATLRNLPIYTVDLSNGLNKPYYSKDNTNPKAKEIKDLRFGDITLLKVKKGVITDAYETIDSIKKLWKID